MKRAEVQLQVLPYTEWCISIQKAQAGFSKALQILHNCDTCWWHVHVNNLKL